MRNSAGRAFDRTRKANGSVRAAARLAAIVLDSNDAIILLDMDGNILAWNRGAREMYGYSEDEALRMNIISIVPEGERAKYNGMMDRLRRGEAITSFQTKRVTKDGRVLDVWLTVTVLKDESGRPYNISKIERDITEIKRTEESLRASNESLKVSEEELKANIEELSAAEEQLREKVEELHATEAPLRRLAAVVMDSNDAILLLDFEGKILAWNRGAEKMYGYSEAEIVNENVRALYPEAGEAPMLSLLKKLQKGEEVSSFETLRMTRDGRVLDVWVTVTALKDDEDKPYMVSTTERDITDMKRNAGALENALRKLQYQTEQLETSKEELEVMNEELLSTNNELDSAIKTSEEKKKMLEDYSSALLGAMQAPLYGLNARVKAMSDELKGSITRERRKELECLLKDDREVVSVMRDVTSILKIFALKVQVERVDLSSMVASILEDIKREEPQSTLKFSIARMLYAYADGGMIGTALRYILQDSWAHVHKEPYGVIIFMLTVDRKKFSFAICDNRTDYNSAGSKWLLEEEAHGTDVPPPGKLFT